MSRRCPACSDGDETGRPGSLTQRITGHDSEKKNPGQELPIRPGCIFRFVPRPMSGRGRMVMRRYSHGMLDSATALFLGAASAALGRGLLNVTLCRSLLGATFRAASAALCRAAASHHAGACEETGNANPCQELPEFLCVHGTPPLFMRIG